MPLGTVVFSYFNFKTLLVFGVVGVGDLLTCILLKFALKSLKWIRNGIEVITMMSYSIGVDFCKK